MGIFPKHGVNIRKNWNHHLDNYWSVFISKKNTTIPSRALKIPRVRSEKIPLSGALGKPNALNEELIFLASSSLPWCSSKGPARRWEEHIVMQYMDCNTYWDDDDDDDDDDDEDDDDDDLWIMYWDVPKN